MSKNNQNTIVILVIVLLILFVAAGAVGYFVYMSSDTDPTVADEQFSDFESDRATSSQMSTNVFDRSRYQQINTGLIEQGVIPAVPPETRGKANPFLQ